MMFRMNKILELRIKLLRTVRNKYAYACDGCEYDAKYLNNLKKHNLAQHEGFKS